MSGVRHSHSLRGRAVQALGTLALTLVAMSTTRGSPARLVFWRRREVEDVGRLRDDEPNPTQEPDTTSPRSSP